MPKKIYIYDLIMLFIAIISITSMVLLTLSFFYVSLALIIGSVVSLIIFFSFNLGMPKLPSLKNLLLGFCIILFALLFRLGPSLYIIGGQDEGLYVNMAATLNKYHSTFYTDNIRKNIKNPQLHQYYDTHNQYFTDKHIKHNRNVFLGKVEGVHFPGVFISSLKNSIYYYQFYPLHPIWMAIFAKLFGEQYAVYSLWLFSLISIFFFIGIISEITQNDKIAIFSGALLLILSPVHAYFSIFPVSEIPALAFLLGSFYYLLKYYYSDQQRIGNFYLLLSSLLIGCCFFARISGFIDLPLYLFLYVIAFIFKNNTIAFKSLNYYFLSVIILFILSVLYGLKFSFAYSYSIYKKSLPFLFLAPTSIMIAGILIFISLLFIGIHFLKKTEFKNFLVRHYAFFHKSLVIILYAVILASFYRAYQLGFTNHFINVNYNERFHFANLGFKSFEVSSVFIAINYLSIIGFILVLYGIYAYLFKKINLVSTAITVFAILGWFYGGVMQAILPLQYYYSRYLLTEVLPVSYLIISLGLTEIYRKNQC